MTNPAVVVEKFVEDDDEDEEESVPIAVAATAAAADIYRRRDKIAWRFDGSF